MPSIRAGIQLPVRSIFLAEFADSERPAWLGWWAVWFFGRV
jgi:hypothetical protein